jgi:hypothetical protein
MGNIGVVVLAKPVQHGIVVSSGFGEFLLGCRTTVHVLDLEVEHVNSRGACRGGRRLSGQVPAESPLALRLSSLLQDGVDGS